MKLHRYVDHQRLHIVTNDVISLSISVLLLFRHYISHKITFGAPSSGGVLRSACGAFISIPSRCQTVWIQIRPDIFVGPDLGPNCLQRLSADINSRPQRAKLNTKQLVDTTFWLKPWLKLISFGSNFFHLAKVLATTNSESG